MISKKDRLFNLSTKHTSYLFAITETDTLSTFTTEGSFPIPRSASMPLQRNEA
jgi:hypothetical protein